MFAKVVRGQDGRYLRCEPTMRLRIKSDMQSRLRGELSFTTGRDTHARVALLSREPLREAFKPICSYATACSTVKRPFLDYTCDPVTVYIFAYNCLYTSICTSWIPRGVYCKIYHINACIISFVLFTS